MADKEVYDFVFKFILIGNGSSGKTSLLYQFIHNKQKKAPTQTIGVEFSSKLIPVQGKSVKLQLWDTAGQERYRSITKTYYRGALGALILFDLTNNDSFNAVEQWIRDAREFSRPDIQIIVVGNKADMDSERVISTNIAQQFCQEQGVSYIETSAMTGQNVNEAFSQLAKKILDLVSQGLVDPDSIKPRFLASGQKVTALQQDKRSCNC